jgi:nucleoside-diphosphate-sugar epimerase
LIPGDGTTLGQIGHVDDEARALRMMMQEPRTFGRRYNLTGGDYYSDEGYVDTFAEVVGAKPEKVFIPADLMDDLWQGRISLSGKPIQVRMDTRASVGDSAFMQRFSLQRLIQRLAPNLHYWNRSVLFSIDRLRRDVGWEPEYSFRGAVQQTWEWMVQGGLDKSLEFDFSFEDELLDQIE